MGNMISNYIERMKASFVPQIDEKARIAMDGTVCVRTNTANGKEWLGVKDNEMVSYPEEMLLNDIPVYTVAKTIDQIKPGDIVKSTSSTYSRVEKVYDGKVYSVSFGGNVRKNQPITDFLTQQKTIRVVVNPFSFGNGVDNNMMMLLMLDGEKNDIAEVMMMASMLGGSKNPFGGMMNNPMMMLMLSKNNGGSMKDFMILQMMQNCGIKLTDTTPKTKEQCKEVVEKVTEVAEGVIEVE